MSTAFLARMAELDAIVEACRGHGAFSTGVITDESNRSNRDWPWWAVQVAVTEQDGSEKRRATATITLTSDVAGEPDSFNGRWMAQIWTGVSPDSYHEHDTQTLDWEQVSPELMQDTMTVLLAQAQKAIRRQRP